LKIDIIVQPGSRRIAYGEAADAYCLGTVESLIPEDKMIKDINRHWAMFKTSKPDWDGDFLSYLSKCGFVIHPCNRSILLQSD
jgi:hypothetical protein